MGTLHCCGLPEHAAEGVIGYAPGKKHTWVQGVSVKGEGSKRALK